MKSKDELLAELAKYGIDPEKKFRKPRNDAGKAREKYATRSDKGKVRGAYTTTATKCKSIYERMLTSHITVGSEEGADTLTRDKNDIFPPNITRLYRTVTKNDSTYIASVPKTGHIEQARWRWLMAEYAEDPVTWGPHISKLYFIRENEIPFWTYTEWAWAYVHRISGLENRLIPEPIILEYDEYMRGLYNGHPSFNTRGEIVWPKEGSK